MNWYKRYKTEGNYLSRKVGGKKGRISEQDVATYVNNNPNFILSEMGKHFGMSAPGALYWLRKLGYSYKKKPSAMWKQVKKSEISTRKS
jgi:transposase